MKAPLAAISLLAALAALAQEEAKPLKLEWIPNEETSDVFDTASEAKLAWKASCALELAGKDAKAFFECHDAISGKPVWKGESQLRLPQGEASFETAIPASSLARNGVYKLELKLSAPGGVAGSLEQQFAVIPPRRVPSGEFDEKSPYSVNYFKDWRLAARIGARKVRQTYFKAAEFDKYVPLARENGMLVNGPYLSLRVKKEETPEALRSKLDDVVETFSKLRKSFPDLVVAQEIYNEPENWPPTSRETDLLPFAALVAKVKPELQRRGVDLKVISPGTTHRNLSFLKALAVVGGKDCVDAVAVHGYRSPSRPEYGHEEDFAAIKELFGDKPVYVDEDAYFASSGETEAAPSITLPVNSMIETDELTQGVYLQRVHLCQLAAGYSLVNQFDSIKSHSLSESRFHRRPGIASYAALTHTLPHPVFKGRTGKASDPLWLLDWESDGESWTSVWTLNEPLLVELKAPGGAEAFDCFANPIAKGERLSLPVGGAPLFVKAKALELLSSSKLPSLDALAVVLPEERGEIRSGLSLEFGGRALDMKSSSVWIELENVSKARLSGSLSPAFMNGAPSNWGFEPASASYSLEPGRKERFEFKILPGEGPDAFDPYDPKPGKGYASLWWTEGFRIAAKLKPDASGEELFVPMKRPLCLRGLPRLAGASVDAQGDEWTSVPEFKQLGAKKRNLALAKFWSGAADYKPVFKMAWDAKGLLFYAEVLDDKHDASQSGLNAWRTDSVQIGLDPRHWKPLFNDYLVLTLSTSGPALLQRATPSLPAGPLNQIELKTSRVEGSYEAPGVTRYECRVPWELIGLKPEPGATLGFSVLFNESDGWWRKGWEGYFMQMGGHIVDPRFFGDLTLVAEGGSATK